MICSNHKVCSKGSIFKVGRRGPYVSVRLKRSFVRNLHPPGFVLEVGFISTSCKSI